MNVWNKFVVPATLLLAGCGSFSSQGSTAEDSLSPQAVAAMQAPGLDSLPQQTFEVLPDEPRTILGAGGTLVNIPARAFVNAAGQPVSGPVSVSLKEARRLEDLMRGRISTFADSHLLSTAGSFFIGAEAAGQALALAPGKSLTVSLPAFSRDPEMQLFLGQPTANDINWKLAKKPEQQPLRKPEPPRQRKPQGYEVLEKLYSLEQIKGILKAIEEGRYQREGDRWVATAGSLGYMNWSVEFVEQCRDWLAYHQDQEAALKALETEYQAEKARLREAWDVYRRNLLDYQIAQNPEKAFYRFTLDQMGWFNCDKYGPAQLVKITGSLQRPDGKPAGLCRVHLLSREEMVHVQSMTDQKGRFVFMFLPGAAFEIHAFRGTRYTKQAFRSEVREDLVVTFDS